MHIHVPPSDGDRNIIAIKGAIDRKVAEVQRASKQLDELQAELRGLQAALAVISPMSLKP